MMSREADEVVYWDEVVAEDRAADRDYDAKVDAGVARLVQRVKARRDIGVATGTPGGSKCESLGVVGLGGSSTIG
ncbi:MAG: hypothetical protein ACRDV9_10960 [Acidimicrobiia bacterium]